MMSTYSRVRASGFGNGRPYQPSTTCGPLTPSPRIIRPPVRWSRVSVCMAADVGVRPDSWTMAVPSLTFEVRLPHQARGVNASEPHASAAKTESKPGRLGGLHELAHTLRGLGSPVPQLQSELHPSPLSSR